MNCMQEPPNTCETKLLRPGSVLPQKMHRGDTGPLNRNESWFVRKRRGTWLCSRAGKGCNPLSALHGTVWSLQQRGITAPVVGTSKQKIWYLQSCCTDSAPFHLIFISASLCLPLYLPTHSNKNSSVHRQLILKPAESILNWSIRLCWDCCISTRATHTSKSSHHQNGPAMQNTLLGDLHTGKGRKRVLL